MLSLTLWRRGERRASAVNAAACNATPLALVLVFMRGARHAA
jgi:hypothetical protein